MLHGILAMPMCGAEPQHNSNGAPFPQPPRGHEDLFWHIAMNLRLMWTSRVRVIDTVILHIHPHAHPHANPPAHPMHTRTLTHTRIRMHPRAPPRCAMQMHPRPRPHHIHIHVDMNIHMPVACLVVAFFNLRSLWLMGDVPCDFGPAHSCQEAEEFAEGKEQDFGASGSVSVPASSKVQATVLKFGVLCL